MGKRAIGAEDYYGVVCEKFEEAKDAGCIQTVVSSTGIFRESALLAGKNDMKVAITPQRDSVLVEYDRSDRLAIALAEGISVSASPLKVAAEPKRLSIALRDCLQPASYITTLGLFQATRRLTPNTQLMDTQAQTLQPREVEPPIQLDSNKTMAAYALSLVSDANSWGGSYVERYNDGIVHTAASTDDIRLDILSDPAMFELLGEFTMMLSTTDGEPYPLETYDMILLDDEHHIIVEGDSGAVLVDPLINEQEIAELTSDAIAGLKQVMGRALPHPI